MKALPEIVSIKEKVEQDLLKRPGVTGVDVGYKYVGGKKTDQISIRVLVAKKRKNVSHDEAIPAEIEGVPTDVIERRFELHQMNRKKVEDIELMADTTKYPTLKGGIGIGPCRSVGGYVYVGTLGAIVKDNATNQPMMLSNFHVMCIDNTWAVGNTMAQPSRVDGGSCPGDVVGSLQRAALTNKVDGAVASISGRPHVCEIHEIGAVTGSAVAALGTAVRKRGRTTGLTYGTVDSISLSVTVDYGPGIGNKTLTNQIGIAADTAKSAKFGDHGDSGSVVVDGSGKVLGLYFAGDSSGYGVANQIADVLSALNVTLCVSRPKTILSDHKAFVKDAVIEKSFRKEFIKEHIKEAKLEKLELKEHSKSEFELPKTLEGPIGQIPGNPINPGVPGGPGFGGGGPNAGDASGIHPGLTGPIKKLEIKEFKEKELKEWSKDKIEIKDFKPELKDHKEFKQEIKEHIKELKAEKLERKEHGKPEFDKAFEVPGQIPEQVLNPGGQTQAFGFKTVEAKYADGPLTPPYKYYKEYYKEHKEVKEIKDVVDSYQYEIPRFPGPGPIAGGVGPLSPFISQDLRPDLSTGALKQECDCSGQGDADYASTSQRLQKEAADAMQAKVAFDNAQPQA